MSSEKFVRLLRDLPHVFQLFGAFIEDEVVAAALVVRLNQDVAYVLYWGDTPAGRARSAVAPLASFLAGHYGNLGVSILDLGISSVKGIIDDGLARFKENLGSEVSLKLTCNLSIATLERLGEFDCGVSID
jgi:hypothetical protein